MRKISEFVVNLLVFLFPLFFLPTAQEFFITNKFYLLGGGVLILLLSKVIEFAKSKKITWIKTPYDAPLIAFIAAYAVSVVVSSPNKVQALLNPANGFLTILFLAIFYFVYTQSALKVNLFKTLSLSAVVIAVLGVIYFFNPFANLSLPANWSFLKNSLFTPLGSPVDLVIFLGFFVVYGISQFTKKQKNIFYLLILVGFVLSLYTLFKPIPRANPPAGGPSSIYQTLPPYSVSWYSAVETLKNPKTAFFGVGPDNFASIYTRVKTPQYNATPLWNVNFTQSRSYILQLWTETGILGLATFIVLLFATYNIKKGERWTFWYMVLVLLFFPPSLNTLFLLFVLFCEKARAWVEGREPKAFKFEMTHIIPAYGVLLAIFILALAGTGYLLGRSYVAEYKFKKALDGFGANDAKQVYDNVRSAVLINPYIERYRISFSQVNYLIANNIAAKSRPKAGETTPQELSAQDKDTIGQAIQASINEAKAAVALNPNKASHWENLAAIYRNLLNAAQGADSWTVASYQRAIVMDPQNPIYRINLGGVYYALKNYDEAQRLFAQAVQLKPDWANAYYNLAWANYQKQDYIQAATAMNTVLKLLEKNKDSADYKKAAADLEDFKAKIPTAESTGSGELKLPQPPPQELPKLNLPKSASPEAR